MADVHDVEVTPLSPRRLGRLIGNALVDELVRAAIDVRAALDGACVWNVNSTSMGGGVAEMLRNIVGYAQGSGIDAHWLVIEGDEQFFRTTKRLHNRLHGVVGDGGELGPIEADHYRAVLAENAAVLSRRVRKGDVVILHDPQTAGLAASLSQLGARVVWRCHIGTDRPNGFAEEGWRFLQPFLAPCQAYVFSHRGSVPPLLEAEDVHLIAPSIDPFSAKNRALNRAQVDRLLVSAGLFDDQRQATMANSVLGKVTPLQRDDRLVVQVSRWDRLKDMRGVLEGFATMVEGRSDVHLALVGPELKSVVDDPEDAGALNECITYWESLPKRVRGLVRIVQLPMDDVEANGLMVNALQRHATVVVQKSLQEGFGITVAEAMWKARPVVASAVGGIVDQIVPGTGVLLEDPTDLDNFGRVLANVLEDPDQMAVMGRRARSRIRTGFLSNRHLVDYARLVEEVTQMTS
jgi:trehalose synthase